jgi:hypothetical protein
MKLQPAPIGKITKDDLLTTPWQIWFRNVSTNLTNSCRIFEMTNYSYSINGNILTVHYIGFGNESLSLPYQLAEDSFVQAYRKDGNNWNLFLIDLEKGTSSIVIPNGEIRIKDFVIIEQANR